MATESNENNFVRQIAYIVKVKDILSSQYYVTEGWNPNYILIRNKEVSRVNIIGTIISDISEQDTAESKILSFDIDDGSGSLNVRLFNEKSETLSFSIGDTVLLVGRVREYNSQRYMALEIWKKLENKIWVEHRQKELEFLHSKSFSSDKISNKSDPSSESNTIEVEELSVDSNNNIASGSDSKINSSTSEDTLDINTTITKQTILDTIKDEDSGDGVSVENLCKILNKETLDNDILDLLKQGEIFEIKPGFVKIL